MNKYYFINKFDTNIIDKQDKQTAIIYRNYNSKKIDQHLILKIKKYCMLIYNKTLSVCPVTTHLPVNQVANSINKKETSTGFVKFFTIQC